MYQGIDTFYLRRYILLLVFIFQDTNLCIMFAGHLYSMLYREEQHIYLYYIWTLFRSQVFFDKLLLLYEIIFVILLL